MGRNYGKRRIPCERDGLDAKSKISDEKELEKKIQHIKENQILGVEILGNVYVLAVLNMVLMDGVGAKMINGDSHTFNLPDDFPANVFLLNPPYSADGKGFVFVYEATRKMAKGYAAVIIQDSAGNGQGLPYTKKILEHCTLEAAVKMPNVFNGKASISSYLRLTVRMKKTMSLLSLTLQKMDTQDRTVRNPLRKST